MAQQARVSMVREMVSPEEWQARVDLAAAYRLVALFGWDDLVFTHISARVPGPEHQFLINPYGMMFDEITASSLVKVGLDGNILMETPYNINPAGFTIHSAVHAAREDALCVMHTHSYEGVAVSAQKEGLLPLSQHSMFALCSIGYHDYEGVALNEDEKPRLVKDLACQRPWREPAFDIEEPRSTDGRRQRGRSFSIDVQSAARLQDPGAGAIGRSRADPHTGSRAGRRGRPDETGYSRNRRRASLARPHP
jgi:hypothetical protein